MVAAAVRVGVRVGMRVRALGESRRAGTRRKAFTNPILHGLEPRLDMFLMLK
jgi:hypothetical protein